ncbi:MAG: macrolide family glycosyltransferase [Candidatus Dormibacteraceae bacterium]
MKKHFAFLSVAASGHINPTLALIEELVRRGYRVSHATNHRMTPAVETTGATVVPVPENSIERSLGNSQFTSEKFFNLLKHRISDARRTLPSLLTHFRQDRPDAICYDVLGFNGQALSKKMEIPGIALMPSFAFNEKFSLRRKFFSELLDRQPPELLEFQSSLRTFNEEYGLDFQLESSMTKSVAPLNLVFLPREFQIAAETFDDRFRFLGPSLRHEGVETWRPASGNIPILFISLGTVFNSNPEFFRMCFEAFGGSDWQVAMAIGEHIDPDSLGEIPANFELRPYFPQLAVLKQAKVFLSHCGINSTMESLYFGVPLVGVPQMLEQETNADRVEELSLGRQLNTSKITAKLLRHTVDEIAQNSQIRERVTRMSQIIRSCGGAPAGADSIEQYLLSL